MSHLLTGLIACPEIQNRLDSNFTSCDPTKFSEPMPLVQFLSSPVNTNNILNQLVSPGQGKKRIVTLTWTPRVCEDEVGDNTCEVVCASPNESGMLSENYEIDLCNNVYIHERFDANHLADICQSNESYFAERIQAMINGLMRKLETRLVADLAAHIGGFAEGETGIVGGIKYVQTKFSDGKPDTNLLEEVTFASMNAGYCGAPYLFGYYEAWKYFKRLQAGCCADSGINLLEMLRQQGMVIMPSYRVTDLFGANDFISVSAGALQLLHYNEFQGADMINEISGGAHRRGIIFDPLTGLPIDILMNFPCDGKLTVFLRFTYKLVGLPTDLFSACDRINGVTQVNRYRIVNPV